LFRHSFATKLFSESDISIKDLCKVMGHADEQTIYRYIHKKREDTILKDKLNRIYQKSFESTLDKLIFCPVINC